MSVILDLIGAASYLMKTVVAIALGLTGLARRDNDTLLYVGVALLLLAIPPSNYMRRNSGSCG
jgi:hypothetical protein